MRRCLIGAIECGTSGHRSPCSGNVIGQGMGAVHDTAWFDRE